MLVDEWVEQVWQILTIRKKTLKDYQNLYRRHLKPLIGHMKVNEIDIFPLQQKLLSQKTPRTLGQVRGVFKVANYLIFAICDFALSYKGPVIWA